jgi:hypothetical protein
MEAEEPSIGGPPAWPPAPAASTVPVAADLSAEIAAAIDREPGDRVRVTWISGCNYRCNWLAPVVTANYDNPTMPGLMITTHRVRKSRFLSVTRIGSGLLIK